jgi:hypothetical protein
MSKQCSDDTEQYLPWCNDCGLDLTHPRKERYRAKNAIENHKERFGHSVRIRTVEADTNRKEGDNEWEL